ncbi:hypothetical protein L210DRAFT_3386278 [Boletus edulis BED1]|uniref:Uncharacterized protein n=1 Tax=Boletus edulis BED1 TaxID=1328754 RepID=A0AAD4C7M5_BOLED|nr:hypothetical protein L210DRAFT_3386278 [Boletus edulis BED1]
MIDTENTGNFMSLAFVKITGMNIFPLEQQLMLQLGCIGSQLKITHGGKTHIEIGRKTSKIYFDVANINQYNCILGIPFLQEQQAVLNFLNQMIQIGNDRIALLEEGHLAAITTRATVVKLMGNEVPQLRNRWFHKYSHWLGGIINRLPPLREVNHRILLIEEEKHYAYHLSRCTDALKQQLLDKI